MKTHPSLTPLARYVLRALQAQSRERTLSSLDMLLAVVPADPLAVRAEVEALDAAGYLDASQLRLTMRGFAAAHARRAVAFERRQSVRSDDFGRPSLRKGSRVA